jgi:hypothetical protein
VKDVEWAAPPRRISRLQVDVEVLSRKSRAKLSRVIGACGNHDVNILSQPGFTVEAAGEAAHYHVRKPHFLQDGDHVPEKFSLLRRSFSEQPQPELVHRPSQGAESASILRA